MAARRLQPCGLVEHLILSPPEPTLSRGMKLFEHTFAEHIAVMSESDLSIRKRKTRA